MNITSITVAIILACSPALAAKPVPVMPSKPCPIGYHPSSGYCMPNTSATRSAIPI